MKPNSTPKRLKHALASFLLALTITLGLLPAVVSAAEEDSGEAIVVTSLPQDTDPSGIEVPLVESSEIVQDSSVPESSDSSYADFTSSLPEVPDSSLPALVSESSELLEEDGPLDILPMSADFNAIGSYEDLVGALEKIADEDDKTGTIFLVDDIVLEDALTLSGLTVTIHAGTHTLTAADSLVPHFEISNSTFTLNGGVLEGSNTGGGINAVSNSVLDITGTIIQNCVTHYSDTSYKGGALRIYTGELTMTDVLVDNCSTSDNTSAGGVTIRDASATLVRTTIQNCSNSRAWGGALYVSSGANNTITLGEGSVVQNNHSGVWIDQNSSLYMENSTVTKNNSVGVYVDSGSNLYMNGNSEISYNTTTVQGAGIQGSSRSTLTMTGTSHITNNSTTHNGGGVAMPFGGNTITMRDESHIAHNTSGNTGGGVFIDGGDITMYGTSHISYNSAAWGGGGIFADNSSAKSYLDHKQITLYGTASIIGNTAVTNSGGGVYLNNRTQDTLSLMLSGAGHRIQGNTAALDGGGVYMTNVTYGFFFTRTYFSGNYAGNGAYLTTDANLLNNYENVFGKFVLSKSVPDHKSPYIFNNYDAYHKSGTSVEPLRLIEYFVNGQYRTRQVVDVNTATTAPSLTDLSIILEANESLDGWYFEEDKVGDNNFKWNFDTLITDDNVKLYAKIVEAAPNTHTVTVHYFTTDDGVTKTPVGSSRIVADIADGAVTEDILASEIGADWRNTNKPATGDYGDGVVTGTLPPNVYNDFEVEVVYTKNAYTVTVEYYKDTLDAANLIDSHDAEDIVSGTPTATALDTILGSGWRNLEKPLTGDYKDGVESEALRPNVDEDFTVKVLYQKNTYTITVEYYQDDETVAGNLVGTEYAASVVSGTGTEDALKAALGDDWRDTHKPLAGYHSGVVSDATPLPLTVAKHETIKVLYSPVLPDTVRITYHAGTNGVGGTYVDIGYNTAHTIYTEAQAGVSRTGYEVTGWATTDGGAVAYAIGGTTASLVANLDLYPVWQICEYPLTFDAQGGTPEPASNLQEYNSLITKPGIDPNKEGHTFVGWYKDAAGNEEWIFDADRMPAGPLTLYAGYDVNYYQVVFYNQGSVYWDTDVAYGQAIVKPADPSRNGYTFEGWLYKGSRWDFNTTMPAERVELNADWKQVTTTTPTTTTPTTQPETTTSQNPTTSASTSQATTTSRGGGGGTSTSPTTSVVPTTSYAPASSSSSASSSGASSSSTAAENSTPSIAEATSEAETTTNTPTPVDVDIEAQGGQGQPGDDDYIQPNGFANIFGNEVPIGGWSSAGGWSLFNLMLAVIALIGAAVGLARILLRRKNGGEGFTLWATLALVAGILPLLLVLILEPVGGTLILYSRWTPLVIAVCVIETILGVVSTIMRTLQHRKQ